MRTPLLLFTIWIPLSYGADLPAPPTYSKSELASSSEAVVAASNAWNIVSRNLEADALALPMTEGKARVQKAYSAMLTYVTARSKYADAVSAYLENHIGETQTGIGQITIDEVSADELDLLGRQLTEVQKCVDNLRASPEWVRIRRSILSDRSALEKLENARRDRIPDTVFAKRPEASSMQAAAYRQSAAEVVEAIQSIWSHYYQALADAIYLKADGSVSPAAKLAASSGPSLEPDDAHALGGKLVGAWTYTEGSLQFNGVSEPKHVVLELWIENGRLSGRYRADLTGFDGPHHVDLRLAGEAPKGREQWLTFGIPGTGETGKIVVQGPNASGVEIMLVRPAGLSNIPRGREVLTRR